MTSPVVTSKVDGTQGGGGWYVGDVTITWTIVDADSKVTDTAGCDPVVLTADAIAKVLTCTATSAGGSGGDSVVINRDTIAPIIGCPVGAQRVQGSLASLSATVADGASGPTAPLLTAALPTDVLGPVKLSFTAADIAGNAATTTCTAEIIPDTSPPVITHAIDGVVGLNGWYTGDVAVSFSVSDPDSTILSAVGCGPQVVTADGASTVVTCTATSSGGTNSDSVPVGRDATPPAIACPAAPSIVQGSTRSLTAAVSDLVSGPAVLTVSGSLPSTTLGAAAITLSAADLAGNGATVQCGYLVVADVTAPVVEAQVVGQVGTSPASDARAQDASGTPWYIGPVTVSFSVTEDESILLDQSGCGTTVITADTTGQTVTCSATSYGLTTTRSVVIALDMTPPVVTCTDPPVFVQGTVGKVGATFSDATSGPTSLSTSLSVDTVSSLGLSYVPISTQDAAGNIGTGSCGFRVIADDTKPVITPTIDGATTSPGWYTGLVTVTFDVADPDSPVLSTEGCEPATVTADTISQVVASCRATSYGGTSVQPVTISRDSVAPVVTCLSLAFVEGTDGKATANAQDATSGVASALVSQSADTSTPGKRSVTLSSTDRAGNTGSERCYYDVVERKTVAATKLSSTGSDVVPMVLGGIALAVAGTTLAILARRRAHRHSRHSA